MKATVFRNGCCSVAVNKSSRDIYIYIYIGRHGKIFLSIEEKIVHFRRLVVFEKEVYLVHYGGLFVMHQIAFSLFLRTACVMQMQKNWLNRYSHICENTHISPNNSYRIKESSFAAITYRLIVLQRNRLLSHESFFWKFILYGTEWS